MIFFYIEKSTPSFLASTQPNMCACSVRRLGYLGLFCLIWFDIFVDWVLLSSGVCVKMIIF